VKRAWIAAGLLCVQTHAEEAGFPAIRVGDAWVYSGYEKDKRLRSEPLHFKVEVESESAQGRLVPVHRDPRISDDQQIGQVLDEVPAATCVTDLLAGIEILSKEQCALLPRLGSTWSRLRRTAAPGSALRLDFRYAARKRIKVPAGRFLAHRFEVDQVTVTASGESRVRRVYWYSPEVRGLLVMESQPFDILDNPRWPRMRAELQSFTPAEQPGP
jgi:hypothetical protein